MNKQGKIKRENAVLVPLVKGAQVLTETNEIVKVSETHFENTIITICYNDGTKALTDRKDLSILVVRNIEDEKPNFLLNRQWKNAIQRKLVDTDVIVTYVEVPVCLDDFIFDTKNERDCYEKLVYGRIKRLRIKKNK